MGADGRYCKDFGDILMTHLRGWDGSDSWAASEQAWLEPLVAADDPISREELRAWIEGSLVETLREVRKDFNRGLLTGGAHSAGTCGTSCGHACDIGGARCQPTTCCHCTFRGPSTSTLLAMKSWGQRRGWATGFSFEDVQWRFFCTGCSRASTMQSHAFPLPFGGHLVWDRTLTHLTQIKERVEPQACNVESDWVAISEVTDWDAWSEACLSSEEGSWMVV